MTFTAQYPGVCADCGEMIRPGQEVGYLSDRQDRALAHAACPTPRPELICPTCHVALPTTGVCDDCR